MAARILTFPRLDLTCECSLPHPYKKPSGAEHCLQCGGKMEAVVRRPERP